MIYANTGKDSDTSVVPIEKGVETFTSIRSQDAKEDCSVRVDLPGGVQLEQIDETSVAIIDPSPAKPSDDDLPAPAAPGTAEAAKAREISGLTEVKDADPNALADARAGVEAAGLTKPDVVDSQITDTKPDLSAAHSLGGQPPAGPPNADNGAVDEAALDAAKVKAEQQAKAMARDALELASSTARTSTASANRNNAAETADTPVIVAKVTAPASVDANGEPVATTLKAEGDVITMSCGV